MPETPRVLFVCQHGAAKSVIAAHHLQRMAHARGLSLECSSAGLDPDDSIPPHVTDGLRDDGLEPVTTSPGKFDAKSLDASTIVISMGCDLSAAGHLPSVHVHWEGVPAVSDGYETARDDITRRLASLLDDLTASSS